MIKMMQVRQQYCLEAKRVQPRLGSLIEETISQCYVYSRIAKDYASSTRYGAGGLSLED